MNEMLLSFNKFFNINDKCQYLFDIFMKFDIEDNIDKNTKSTLVFIDTLIEHFKKWEKINVKLKFILHIQINSGAKRDRNTCNTNCK